MFKANIADLLYSLCEKNEDLCKSLADGLVRLMYPELVVIDGCVLNKEIGADKIYQERRSEGLSCKEAQAWANLFELTETLRIEPDVALKLAEPIRRCWETAIADQQVSLPHYSRIARDDELGEIYVTIDQSAS